MKNKILKEVKPVWKFFFKYLLKIYAGDFNLLVQNLPKKFNEKNYSQFGQDVFVNNFFNKKDGIFVDVGANYPVNGSNTYLLEQNGWTGLAIEPQENLRNLWANERKTPCLKYVIGTENKMVTFSTGNDEQHGLAGVSGFNKLTISSKKIELEQRRLDDILNEYNIKDVDYLSIDVEGYEMNVLKSIDFSKTNIKLIGLENDLGFKWLPFIGKRIGSELGSDELRKFLKDKGYKYIARIVCDDFFVKI